MSDYPLAVITAFPLVRVLLRLEPRYDDRAAFIAAFLDRLDRIPHVEVVPLTGESAVEGLKDRILQRLPAKTKTDQEVKTTYSADFVNESPAQDTSGRTAPAVLLTCS